MVASLHTRFEAYLRYYHLSWLDGWTRRRLDRFYGSSDFILVPTCPIAAAFEARGWGRKLGVWGRGVDHDIFSPKQRDRAWRRSHGYADDDVIVLFFGRLVLEKGIDMFATVIALLRARGLSVRPLVIGDGPARARLAARLGDAVLVGHLDEPALGRAVASADVLVNPSATEAFGNVNLEAMASGLAIVSADAPSATALIEHGRTGILVPASDKGAYANAVERLIRHPQARATLGSAAADASDAFDWRQVFGPVINAYRRTSANQGATD